MVSIIIPAYNLATYLPETLDSVLNQTEKDWECLIIDDGSTDHTAEVANQYVAKDGRFKYFKKENGGVSDTRNYGIARSAGKYILPLDADDLIDSEYIQEAVSVLEHNPSVKVVYCNAELFGEQSGQWNLPDYSFEGLLRSNMIFVTALFRKSDYLQTEGFSPEMKGGLEDWDFWLSLLETGGDVYKLSQTYFLYRIRDKSRTRLVDEALETRLRLIVYKRHIDTYVKYWGTPFELIRFKDDFLALTGGKEYRVMKKIYAPIKKIRQLVKI